MTARSLIAATWLGAQSGHQYFDLYDQASVEDMAVMARFKHRKGFASVPVEIDFNPATSQMLNRPTCSEIEAQRDGLRIALALLRDAVVEHHGCFPIDKTTAAQRSLNLAMMVAVELVGPVGEPSAQSPAEPTAPEVCK
jgi:hypothetical protein